MTRRRLPARARLATVILGAGLAAGFAALSTNGFGLSGAEHDSTRPDGARPHVTLVYVGADNCAPCRTWQDGAGRDFRASAVARKIHYHEVKSPTLQHVLHDDYWPAELRELRDGLGKGVGVPLWLVVSDERVVLKAGGISQWREAVLPALKSLVR